MALTSVYILCVRDNGLVLVLVFVLETFGHGLRLFQDRGRPLRAIQTEYPYHLLCP